MKPAWILVLVLAGCATNVEQHIAATKDSWNGAAYDDVVRRWGAPIRSTTLQDGREAHTWVSERFQPGSAVIPTVGIFGGSGGGGVGAGVSFGSGATPQRCERTLIFKDRAIVEQNWSGPPDYCNTFGRS
jgi:hypothetical protein